MEKKVIASKEVEKVLLKMFGLTDHLVERLTIECVPGKLPTATARIYAVELPVETSTVDEMVAAAKVRLARHINSKAAAESVALEADFNELKDRVNTVVSNYSYVTSHTLRKMLHVCDRIAVPVHGQYFPSYEFGTPPSILDNKAYQQKKY